MSETTSTTAALTGADQLRIRAAMNQMPYAWASSIPGYGVQVDADVIVDFLTCLAVRLTGIANEHTDQLEKLHQLESDVAAVRRVFGISEVTR